MPTLIQTRLFDDNVDIVASSEGSYNDFVKKFGRKKTTDDCFTPEPVYNVVKNWFAQALWDTRSEMLLNYNIVRPFYPNADYLTYNYKSNDIVLDNPPFSIYSKIVRNFMRMGVNFFLFAPALSLFVPDSGANYVITGANLIYENGARVRTSFVTNMLPYKILIARGLKLAIQNAQSSQSDTYRPDMPARYWSSAQLLKFCNNENFNFKPINAAESFIKYDKRNKKIFGAAIQIGETDDDILRNI